MNFRTPICIDIDDFDVADPTRVASEFASIAGCFRIGPATLAVHGRRGIEAIAATGVPVMLDLKLHDTPVEVASVIRAIGTMPVWAVTVHVAGGPKMLAAAVDAAGDRIDVLGVAVLATMDNEQLEEVANFARPGEYGVHLIGVAQESGLSGVFCPPALCRNARSILGRDAVVVAPAININPELYDIDVDVGIITPRWALTNGADLVVVGRSAVSNSNLLWISGGK